MSCYILTELPPCSATPESEEVSHLHALLTDFFLRFALDWISRAVLCFALLWDTHFRRYISLDIISMQGNMDTRRWFPVGDYGCQVEAQGGDDRRDRNYAWWVYKNLLAGQPTNVSQFPFYHEVRALIPERMSLQNATLPVRARAQNNGNDPVATQAEYTYTASTVQADARRAQARNPTRAPLFRHRFCVVPDVGHKAPLMWNSTCGHEAFTVPGIAANPSFASYPPLQPQEYRGPGSAQHGSTSSDYD